MSSLYLAGPMSGKPQCNFPLFDEAAAALRNAGLSIISPAELDDPIDREIALRDGVPRKSWGDFLARDVKIIADQTVGIIFLPEWSSSLGAKLEAYTALAAGHIDFGYYDSAQPGKVWWVSVDHIRETLRREMP